MKKKFSFASLHSWNSGVMGYRDVEGKLFCILPKRKLRVEPIMPSVNPTGKTVGF
jgi:hypothetical protein